MQWYEKDPCFHRSFSTGTKMKQSKNYLVCSRRCFPIFTTTEYHGFSLYTVQNEEIQILPPCHTPMTQFFWTPHAVPRNAKNFWKIGGYLLIWSQPWALLGFKIWFMQLSPHRTVNGFNHMTFIYLLLCWKMFQQVLLKAFFHSIAMTTLIEHARTFLYIAINISLLPYIGSCAPIPYV